MTLWIPILAAGLIGAAWLAAWLATSAATRRARQEAEAMRMELQSMVNAQSQTVAAQVNSQIGAQIGQLSQTVTTQYGQVLQQVQTGMASAGTLASNAQKAVSDQLQASTEMLGVIRQELGQMQQASHELGDTVRQMENVLGGVKTRGILGEVALENLLGDTLPPGAYEMQYRFSTGETVDAVVRSREKLLPIDSKFPLEDYRRLMEDGEDHRSGFVQAVRKHADSIARKYILPGEETVGMALMFVPSEGIFCELLQSQDGKGTQLDEYCRARHVVPVSPSMLFAFLRVILMGFQSLQFEENARRMMANLAGLEKELENFGTVYEKIGTHLRNAQQCYADGDRKLDRARNTVAELAQGAPAEKLPEKTLQTTLPID